MTYKIKVTDSTEAQQLNRIAERMPFDVWLHGKTANADAKSLLGMMLLTMESNLSLVVEDDVDLNLVEKSFAQFIVKE